MLGPGIVGSSMAAGSALPGSRNGPLDAVPGFSQPPFAVSKATRAGYGALVQQVGTRSHEDGADFEAEGEAPSEGGP